MSSFTGKAMKEVYNCSLQWQWGFGRCAGIGKNELDLGKKFGYYDD